MHIVDMVYFWARTIPRHPAIIQPDGVISYRTLALAIEKASKTFALSISDKSKPITVSLESPPQMLVAALGLLRSGLSVVIGGNADVAQISPDESNTIVRGRDGSSFDGRTNIVFDESWIQVGASGRQTHKPVCQPKTQGADIYFFTSGTTGRAKRVVRTQKAWDERILFNSTSAFSDYDRVLLVPGLASAFGFTRAYEILYAGKTLCTAPFGQPQLWLANVYEIDLIIASPQQALALAQMQEKVTRYPLSTLKTIRIGGSIIAPEGIERIKSHLCRNIIIAYSSTEAGTVATAPYDEIANIANAVGFVIPDAEVQIVDAADSLLPVGSEGFVRVRTKQFVENFQIEDDSTWFYPGDVGWLTEDDVLCIAGRRGDVVNRGGVKLSVTDFEEFLLTCAGITDAGVCTVMGESGYEEVWVGIVLDQLIDISSFRQSIESSPKFGSNVDKIFVVESIPRGSLGKIRRDELRIMLQSISEGTASSSDAAQSKFTTGVQSPE